MAERISDDEIVTMRRLYEEGYTIRQIAHHTRRSFQSVSFHLWRAFGNVISRQPEWRWSDIDTARTMLMRGATPEEIAAKLGRSVSGVKRKIRKIIQQDAEEKSQVRYNVPIEMKRGRHYSMSTVCSKERITMTFIGQQKGLYLFKSDAGGYIESFTKPQLIDAAPMKYTMGGEQE